MNTRNQLPRIVALVLLVAIMLVLVTGFTTPSPMMRVPPAGNPLAERIGTYDSRLVAFAAFWDEANQARLQSLMHEARRAKEQGDRDRYQSLAKQLSSRQHELHMQVFSTAPIDEVLAGLKDRWPALLREAGVSRLVSQWDDRALAGVSAADRVDVTDRLVREFHVPEAKLRQLDQLKAASPQPLWRVRLLSALHLI